VIRPAVMNKEEAANAPMEMKSTDMTGMPGMQFGMIVSVLDCTGCGSCVNVCPGKKGNKALVMEPLEEQVQQQKVADYAIALKEKQEVFEKFKVSTVKGSQFRQPLLEFHGACAGCGEPPYAKLVTQLFGERMFIANATGCSSIWGGSMPSTPYTVNKGQRGPAWANSLFEDNAEFGYGMYLAQKTLRGKLKEEVARLMESTNDERVREASKQYLATYHNGSENFAATAVLLQVLEQCGCEEGKNLIKNKEFLNKKSQWIFGGDGWAYDIGFGGLDHVIASGEDVNILVFDTEIYSNTGGQSSKSTQTGAVAQFAAAGKEVRKKDLAQIAMSYGYVYVAQVAMGADYNQTIRAIVEAESYNGPSIIIAYSPCISHGIKSGMSIAMAEENKAVISGYWNNFRFDPRLAEKGKNPFQLDSKKPSMDYLEFLMNEVRYSSLSRENPERAKRLFAQAQKNSVAKYEHLKKLEKLYSDL
jgi:pyruvate-ferredoxin/flavodoxin oxidoreductase